MPTPGPGGTNPTPVPGAASALPGNGLENGAPGSASSFGNPEGQGGGPQLREAPPSFTVPGFYGRGAQEFTVGIGRLARPRFRVSASVSQGYDDNVFQTPTHGFHTPAETVPVEVAAPVPASTKFVVVPSGDPNVPDAIEPVAVPAQPAKFKQIHVAAVPASQRLGSWVTRSNASADFQFANRRTLFTFDIGGGIDYYWDRPGGRTDKNANLALTFLQKVSSRAQVTVEVDSSYQTQPDFSQPNLPTSNLVGPYLATNAKVDLAYRLTPRFSTVTSLSYNAVTYEQSQQSNQDYGSTTVGTQLRYLLSPRNTLVGEVRYSADQHSNEQALNTKSWYLLLGDDITLSRRFTASLRLGEEIQSLSGESGGSQSAPYVEATLNYRLGQATSIQWNGRYGYEESGSVNTRALVARSGLQLTQIFSPRLQASLSLNLVRNTTKTNTPSSSSSSSSTPTTPVAAATAAELATPADQIQDTVDASVGFYYTLSRHWTFNLSYQYTLSLGPITIDDYYRQRVFLGATYQFW
jgi:opacity protein-like surface antigen